MKKMLLLLLIVATTIANAQKSEIFTSKSGAIDGYDPVAYFTENKPVKGNPEFMYNWKTANWYFATAQNMAEFKANPEKYAPQYGGYCAYGTSAGHKAPTTPEAFTIVNEKLYLNYNENVMSMWRKDQAALIEKADVNWPKIKAEKE
ncbi:MAG: YHS domain-containing (seleno)protein [Flavobacterium sp.]|nr:YHS domain-containing (seleno)protein [Flavobacterium sp.]